MEVIAEISMYPLTRDYDGPILEFISRLKAYPDVQIQPGETSTTIRGEYARVFGILQEEFGDVLRGSERVVFVMKLLNFER